MGLLGIKMSAPIKVGLPGFGGRMGQMIARLIQEDSSFELVAATETLNSKLIGHDISHNLGIPKTGIKISASADILGNSSDVIIDFTQPKATMEHVQIALDTNTPMAIGTTGLNKVQEKKILDAGKLIPIIYCANTSIGVTILLQQVQQIASKLEDCWDIEIIETHHNQKLDAPTGTSTRIRKSCSTRTLCII